MSKINILGFGGIAPVKHQKFLTKNEAQIADNCHLLSGALEGWRSLRSDVSLAKSGDIKTIYQMESGTWLHWTEVVSVAKSAIKGDTLERTYFSGTDLPRVTSNALADIGGDNKFPESSYKLGIPAPTAAPTAALNGTHTTPADTAYVYCFVSGWGEEGPPSPVSNIVAADFSTGSVDLTALDYPVPATDLNITTYRIYRIASSVSNSEYLFVADVLVNNSTPQYNDSVTSANLGGIMPSTNWYPPPTTLLGLTNMANGMMAGFSGNTVYFCEPFLPHAWPSGYTINVDYDIVGLGVFMNSLVVLTKGFPYIVTGIHPNSMSMSIHTDLQPCVNIRSIVSMDQGVIYSSPEGLYYIGSKGARLITKSKYSRNIWSELRPELSTSSYYDGRYICFFDFTAKGIIFGPEDPDESRLRELNFAATSLFLNTNGSKLYLGIQDANSGVTSINEFNAGGDKLTYLWRSKLLNSGKSTKITACKIKGDYGGNLNASEQAALDAEIAAVISSNGTLISTGATKGSMNEKAVNKLPVNGDTLSAIPQQPTSNSFIFKYYVDDTLVHEQAVYDDKPFRLPRVAGIDHYLEVIGKFPVYEVILGQSIRDLVL